MRRHFPERVSNRKRSLNPTKCMDALSIFNLALIQTIKRKNVSAKQNFGNDQKNMHNSLLPIDFCFDDY